MAWTCRSPFPTRQRDELLKAIAEHQVIFFRDQHPTHEQHKAFGRAFGELAIHSAVAGLDDHPEIVAIHADADSTFVAGEDWHSDLTCDAAPPMGSILYLHTVPETGGDTLFASMYAAYDALSERMKAYLEGSSPSTTPTTSIARCSPTSTASIRAPTTRSCAPTR